jgi:hypothetical protein
MIKTLNVASATSKAATIVASFISAQAPECWPRRGKLRAKSEY